MRKIGPLLVALEFLAVRAQGAEANRAGVAHQLRAQSAVIYLRRRSDLSERKVPCGVRMALPKAWSRKTGTLSGVVRFHERLRRCIPRNLSPRQLAHRCAGWECAKFALGAQRCVRGPFSCGTSFLRSVPRLVCADAKRFAAAKSIRGSESQWQVSWRLLVDGTRGSALLELRAFDSNATSHACIYKAENHGADFGSVGPGVRAARTGSARAAVLGSR